MTVGSFVCVLQMRDEDGNPVETIASLAGPVAEPPRPRRRARDLHVQPRRHPAAVRFLGEVPSVRCRGRRASHTAGRVGIAASVIGAFYYLKVVKTMYFDAPSGELVRGRSPLDFSIITICAAVIVLGYLLNPVLDTASAAAAASLF